MTFRRGAPLLATVLGLIVVIRNLLQLLQQTHFQMTLELTALFHDHIETESVMRLIPDEMTDSLKMLLDAAFSNKDIWDADVDIHTEKERCDKYNLQYNNRTTRRRIFWGSLVADDSWHVLSIAAMEAYGIFDTVALVESNTTQMLYPRTIRFGPDSERLRILRQPVFWGPHTRVSVDYYYDDPTTKGESRPTELWRENLQRDMILERWKHNGMKDDDIGYLSDLDEVATRDFLRALQICDVPQFRPGQDCKKAKVIASTIVFEGSPICASRKDAGGTILI
jgi:Glycosyltransferase family 17